jgi:hypothetical protein
MSGRALNGVHHRPLSILAEGFAISTFAIDYLPNYSTQAIISSTSSLPRPTRTARSRLVQWSTFYYQTKVAETAGRNSRWMILN